MQTAFSLYVGCSRQGECPRLNRHEMRIIKRATFMKIMLLIIFEGNLAAIVH